MNNKNLFILNSLMVLVMLGFSLWAWHQIPATQRIPVHYGIDGAPDRYGDKVEALLFMPLVGVGLTALFAVIPLIDPRAQNLARSQKAYAMTTLAGMALLFSIHTATVLQALGASVSVPTIVAVGVSLLFIIMGNYLGKVRSNFSFGIRTPWTLSSEQSWDKTHRLGGRLLVGLGLGGVFAILVNANSLFLLLMLGGTISISLGLILYSYIVWSKDSARHGTER